MNKILQLLGNNKEISIVFLVIMVLVMMILPIPHMMMDFIITFNICITVIVLMAVIYMESPLSLTSFPSILLVLALVRIGITVSTSRLILLEADAGEIVNTFGDVVVGGNLVVGVIIFIIITMINFIVITKGSERVAEVAARFSLDAMPGKQMAIDADLRAGTITQDDANERRNKLGLESKLYGAMDGAMKFVKGDAIASIVDILINLIGGLIIGIVQLNMPFGDALQKYSILTVGDGLVQQIPQLLISLTAGMMITKVSNDNETKNMGQTILQQIFQDYRALVAAAFLLAIFALVPGMPTLIFLSVAALVLGLAYFKYKSQDSKATSGQADSIVVDEEDTTTQLGEDFVSWKLSPLVLNLANNLRTAEFTKHLNQVLGRVQREILLDIGVSIPTIIVRYIDALPENEYKLLVHEILVSAGKIFEGNILVFMDMNDNVSEILDLEGCFENGMPIGLANNGIWLKASNIDICKEYSISYIDVEEFLFKHLKYNISKHLSDFFGLQEVKNLLDKMTDYQDLIRELLRMLPLNKITEVLQRLISEDISIRNFKVILDALLEWSQQEKDIILITEFVRKALGKYIAFKFSSGTYNLLCIIFTTEFENTIRDGIRYNNFGSYLNLDSDTTQYIIDSVAEYAASYNKGNNIVIVTRFDIRRYVRSVTEGAYPAIPVLSYEEIEDYVKLNSVGVIGIDYSVDY